MSSGHLSGLEGCYLYFNQQKYKWIRSGKTSGEGKDTCFEGHRKKHQANATSKDQMIIHCLYREYPTSGVSNLGATEGCFESLQMYCGVVYDKRRDTSPLRSEGATDSLFV